jgi:demethylmenaquinone methyltransferase/2-methoxy-6-polyprenyl-1,4-benzoquinol methylase
MHDAHQEFFDHLAADWDLRFTAEDLERLQHIVDKIEVNEGWNVLDIGCGTGILFDLLRRRVGKEGSVTGVDFSFQMVRTAYRNFPFDNVNVVDADAINLPFADNSFDVAVAFAAFPHFSDQKRAIEETHRVLKNGARFYIIHLESSKELVEIHHKVGGAVKHDELPADAALRTMLDESTFSDIDIDDHPGLYLATAVNRK